MNHRFNKITLSLLTRLIKRQNSNVKKSSIVSIHENKIQKGNPWQEVITKNGEIYYHNQITNETTAIGENRPIPWIKVSTTDGNHYWWRTDTNVTTALGASQPPRYDIQQYSYQQVTYQKQSLGTSMVTYATLGFGMSMGIMLVSAIFR